MPSPLTSGSTPSCKPEFPDSFRESPEMTSTTKVAVVTGASRGIGAATAAVLASVGFGWSSITGPAPRKPTTWSGP
jgi:hypothetical protein